MAIGTKSDMRAYDFTLTVGKLVQCAEYRLGLFFLYQLAARFKGLIAGYILTTFLAVLIGIIAVKVNELHIVKAASQNFLYRLFG